LTIWHCILSAELTLLQTVFWRFCPLGKYTNKLNDTKNNTSKISYWYNSRENGKLCTDMYYTCCICLSGLCWTQNTHKIRAQLDFDHIQSERLQVFLLMENCCGWHRIHTLIIAVRKSFMQVLCKWTFLRRSLLLRNSIKIDKKFCWGLHSSDSI